MDINNLNDDVLENGFVMPRFNDGLLVIMLDTKEAFYRLFVLLFYLLGCFKVRYYQLNFGYTIKRMVSFHFREWNPISLIAVIAFEIFDFFYAKKSIYFEISKAIIVDVDNYNRAYISEILT
jgi:hypothetical protein